MPDELGNMDWQTLLGDLLEGGTEGVPAESYYGLEVPAASTPTQEGTASWMLDWMPKQTAYWTNLATQLGTQSDQLMQQAMEAYNARMNESADIFNEQYDGLKGTTQNSLQQMLDAITSQAGLYDQAGQALNTGYQQGIDTMTDYANKADLSSYMNDVNTGYVPPAVQALLDSMRANEIANTQDILRKQTEQTVGNQLERLGINRQLDSTHTENTLAKIASEEQGLLNQALRTIENQYMGAMLKNPYDRLNAAVASLAGLVPLGELGKMQAQGGIDMAELLSNQGTQLADSMLKSATGQHSMALSNFDKSVSGSELLSKMPVEFFKMALEKPNYATEMATTQVNNLKDVWSKLLNAQIARETMASNERMSNQANDDSVDIWDILF